MVLRCQQTVLPNGVIVVTDTAPQFQSVALNVSFRSGSAHEPEHLSGISHLLEHMVFRGSHQRSGQDIRTDFARLGGYLNAMTSQDRTDFQAVVLSEDVAEALEIISDFVMHPKLDPDDLVTERRVIEQEACRACPSCAMNDTFYDAAFPKQALRRPVIGFEDTLASISRADLTTHHARSYVARNLTVAASGKIRHDTFVALIARIFDGLPEGLPARAPAASFNSGQSTLAQPSQNGRIRIGFPVSGIDLRALEFYRAMLSAPGDTALTRRLREEQGLVYHAWAEIVHHADTTLFLIETEAAAADMKQVASGLIDTLCETARADDPHLINMEKRRFQMDERMMLDSLSARVARLTAQVSQHGQLVDETARIRDYLDTEAHEIAAAADAMLGQEPAIVALGPFREMPRFAELRRQLARGQHRPSLHRFAAH